MSVPDGPAARHRNSPPGNSPPLNSPVADAFRGTGLLVSGMRFVFGRPRLFWLGAVPPLITSVAMIVVIVVLVVDNAPIVAAVTPFADGWAVREVFRVIVGIALVLGSVLLMVLVFTGLTLAIGAPLYDLIARAADDAHGGVAAEHEEAGLRAVLRMIGQTALSVLISAVVALIMFVIGFIPLVGQLVAVVGSAVIGGWLIAGELAAGGLERRGITSVRRRWQVLSRDRAAVLGFGVPTFLLLSIPLVAVVVFPGAAAGGVLLARRLRGETMHIAR